MSEEENVKSLVKKSGYSDKAISYYTSRTNFDIMENPTVSYAYTGPCGDTMEIFLKINPDDGKIKDAKFQAIGCAGAYVSGSALTEMIKGKTLEEAEKIGREDVVENLNGIPKAKVECACLAVRTLERTIGKYKEELES